MQPTSGFFRRGSVAHVARALLGALFLLGVRGARPLDAQQPPGPDSTARRDSTAGAMASMAGMAGTEGGGGMHMVPDPLGVSMDRLGSGTTWIPDAVALPSREVDAGAWNLMIHGFVFGQYDGQTGSRGGSQFGSVNWGMLMASHGLAGGRFQARTMLSFDAAGVTSRGYPLLLQSGEAFDGVAIHDRQHPHDLWMELGAMYDRPVSERVGLSLYAAPAGEPALGPVAFMHRPSALDIPSAPIGHHWQDATHTSFGVVTAGVFTHDVRIEGSAFNGREPDQNRWDIDPIRFDSYSGRVSYNPNAHWALSAGYGFVKSPEALTPDVSLHRMTASAMYGMKLGADGQLATTAIWGANLRSDRPGLSHSGAVEGEAVLDRRNTVFGRAEIVEKSADDLVVNTPPFNFAATERFDVGAVSLGYVREIVPMRVATLGLGGMWTVNVVPRVLGAAYGSRTPVGVFVFLRVRAVGGR